MRAIAKCYLLIFAVGWSANARTAEAAPIVGGSVVVAADGDVIATYRGNSASFSNDLYLDTPANALGIIFNNHASAVGSVVNLGFFTAGTELIFRLHVNNTGFDYFTGPASRNPDGFAHARIDDADPSFPGETLVEFEDLFAGPFGFNDLSFTFTNVEADPEPPTAAVPEPTSMALLGIGVIGAAFGARRRKNAYQAS